MNYIHFPFNLSWEIFPMTRVVCRCGKKYSSQIGSSLSLPSCADNIFQHRNSKKKFSLIGRFSPLIYDKPSLKHSEANVSNFDEYTAFRHFVLIQRSHCQKPVIYLWIIAKEFKSWFSRKSEYHIFQEAPRSESCQVARWKFKTDNLYFAAFQIPFSERGKKTTNANEIREIFVQSILKWCSHEQASFTLNVIF